jgi:hypothetical protein
MLELDFIILKGMNDLSSVFFLKKKQATCRLLRQTTCRLQA